MRAPWWPMAEPPAVEDRVMTPSEIQAEAIIYNRSKLDDAARFGCIPPQLMGLEYRVRYAAGLRVVKPNPGLLTPDPW